MVQSPYVYDPVHNLIVNEIKAPLVELLDAVIDHRLRPEQLLLVRRVVKAVNRLPMPAHENIRLKNSHLLVDLRDEFFSHERNAGREKALLALFNAVIIVYEYDHYYRNRIDWLLKWLVEHYGEWEPLKPNRPRREQWKE